MGYLLYKDYESGLNNNLMSLELAVGLAYLTQRKLVYYGSRGVGKQLQPCRGGYYWQIPVSRQGVINQGAVPTILDIVDPLPIEIIDYVSFCREIYGQKCTCYHSPIRLVESTFVASQTPIVPDCLAAFAEGRTLLRDVEQDVWHLSACNFGYYSRFFYSPTPSLYEILQGVHPRSIYLNLAQKIAQTLGQFNGIHVRLTDYRCSIPGVDKNYAGRILQNIQANFCPQELLLICTDESENKDFFREITHRYRNHLFLDEWIVHEFKAEFKALPFTDEQTLGLICNLVMGYAQEFAGTLRSTYTGMIHRNWLKNRLKTTPDLGLPFQYIDSGLGARPVSFRHGIYLETQAGLFSWNRIQFPLYSDEKSWFREWPESVILML
ncbi:MAG: hypothetical protein HC835_03035 [Oscillatoriales cyanobacterium RM2_1_1]|nr:hypothetical protein [Oscillatoriales cyanobacterium RM2_1_1]